MEKGIIQTNATIEELKPIIDYFTLKSIKPYLQDEATIQSYLQTQNINVSPSDFLEYYSNLEKEAKSLIKSNSQARALYLKLENPGSLNSQIDSLISYGPKNLEKRFKQSLKHTYNAMEKIGFSFSDNHMDVGRKEIQFSEKIKGVYFTKFSIHNNHIKKITLEYYLGEFSNFDHYTLSGFFKKYWNSFTQGEKEAGRQIKRIIELEDDIRLFLENKNENIKEIFS